MGLSPFEGLKSKQRLSRYFWAGLDKALSPSQSLLRKVLKRLLFRKALTLFKKGLSSDLSPKRAQIMF